MFCKSGWNWCIPCGELTIFESWPDDHFLDELDCCYDKGYQSKLSSTSINLTREGVLNMWWMRGSGWSRLALLIIQILIGNAHNRVTSLESQCILKILETYAEGSYIREFAVVPASMPSGPKGQIFPRWVVPWFSWPIRCNMTKDKSWNSLLKRIIWSSPVWRRQIFGGIPSSMSCTLCNPRCLEEMFPCIPGWARRIRADSSGVG